MEPVHSFFVLPLSLRKCGAFMMNFYPVGANRRLRMKPFLTILGVAALMSVAACDSKQENAVENAYDNKADAIDNQAEKLEDRADNMVGAAEDATENAADALKDKADAVREAGEKAGDRVENATK
jgi:hypothetical protein